MVSTVLVNTRANPTSPRILDTFVDIWKYSVLYSLVNYMEKPCDAVLTNTHCFRGIKPVSRIAGAHEASEGIGTFSMITNMRHFIAFVNVLKNYLVGSGNMLVYSFKYI